MPNTISNITFNVTAPQPTIHSLTLYELILALFSIAALLACIYAVFYWGRQLRLSAAQRSGLLEALGRQELETLLYDLRKKALNDTGLDPDDPKPEKFGDIRQLYEANIHPTYQEMYGGKERRTYYRGTDESFRSEETDTEFEERTKTLKECQDWEKRERERFRNLRHEAEAKAKRKAEDQVPESIDISLLGGGFGFILEFSTVIVIIFAVLILGVLHVLTDQSISTILAAIAGYILGKASSAKKSEETPTATIVTPEAKPQKPTPTAGRADETTMTKTVIPPEAKPQKPTSTTGKGDETAKELQGGTK